MLMLGGFFERLIMTIPYSTVEALPRRDRLAKIDFKATCQTAIDILTPHRDAVLADALPYFEGGMAGDGIEHFGTTPAGIIDGYQTAPYDEDPNDPDNVVIDQFATSEGQSYGLLMALLAGEEARFRQIWTTTKWQFKIHAGKVYYGHPVGSWTGNPWDTYSELCGWKLGRNVADGVWGIMDRRAATDGDLALCGYLLRGYEKGWGTDLLTDAQAMMPDLLTKCFGPGEWLLPCAGNLQHPDFSKYPAPDNRSYATVDTTYFMPELQRLIAKYDPDPSRQAKWKQSVDDGYAFLRQAMGLTTQGFPSVWYDVLYDGGGFRLPPYSQQDNDKRVGWNSETPRLFWHHLDDWVTNDSAAALASLRRFDFPAKVLDAYTGGTLAMNYDRFGAPRTSSTNWPEQFASAAVAWAAVFAPQKVVPYYNTHIAPTFTATQDGGYWAFHHDYYRTCTTLFNIHFAIEALKKQLND